MAAEHWRRANRANWDERVALHLGAECYDLGPLRTGAGRLNLIEEAESGLSKGCGCCIYNATLAATA